jgi:hypothetical protein
MPSLLSRPARRQGIRHHFFARIVPPQQVIHGERRTTLDNENQMQCLGKIMPN